MADTTTMIPLWVGIEKKFSASTASTARVANAQRSDHDGDPRLGRRAAGLGCAEQRAQFFGSG
jgi:hypothetical protein